MSEHVQAFVSFFWGGRGGFLIFRINASGGWEGGGGGVKNKKTRVRV